ncbi:MAG: lectin-like protein [Planctomycetota bacterium]|nr:lectin-like protein [Planctomycetota bacterium]MDP6990212.1 lectin-like protein [Planctomycetota bacterium]
MVPALLAPLTLLMAPSLAAALGGSDDCATPVPIAGQGVFAFDLSAASTGPEGQSESLCLAFGTSGITDDVWFCWTADADGCATLTACGLSPNVDTKIAAYPGCGCPAPGSALACNDDAPCTTAFESQIEWPVSTATTYTLQVGTFPGSPPGPGSFDITIAACPTPVLNPQNGHHYLVVNNAPSWTQARDDAAATSFLGVPGHLVTLSDLQEDQWVYFQLAGGNLGNAWIGLYQDQNAPDYSEPSGGWRWVTGEPVTHENWTAGEPNDGAGAEHYGGYWPADQWNDYQVADGAVGRYVIEYDTRTGTPYCPGDGSGANCPCGNFGAGGEGCANSTGAGAVLAGMGSQDAVADDLQFVLSQALPGQPALLFSGMNSVNGGSGVLFGDGLRCAGGSVKRLGVRVPDGSGAAEWGPGLAPMGQWGPGDVRYFQGWYRDPQGSPCGANFNLSNGVEVVFWP